MGYKYTARKSVMWINGFGFIIGISVMIIAFMPDTQEVGVHNSWLPGFIGFLGILLVIFAIVGSETQRGARERNRGLGFRI
jgi:hypothetical protein